jgi:hypothetical protein
MTDNWFHAEFNERLSHSMAVCAYYVPRSDIKHVWKLEKSLASNTSFETIKRDLVMHLSTALGFMNSWSPTIIMEKGVKLENLKQKYSHGSA